MSTSDYSIQPNFVIQYELLYLSKEIIELMELRPNAK